MISLKGFNSLVSIVTPKFLPQLTLSAGLKHFEPPKQYDVNTKVARPKLAVMQKVPQYPNGVRPPKMQKRLRLMRGPEPVHNFLIHKQYGVIATQGGRMKHPHFEMVRLSIGRALDISRMFAVWRVPAPWQPLSKRGIGVRLGGGKGAIDHYATPIRPGRVIMEIAGKCDFVEVKKMLDHVANNLPFKAIAVSQEMLEEMEKDKKALEESNMNPYSMQYCIQNNFSGCHKWLRPMDHKHFGKYL